MHESNLWAAWTVRNHDALTGATPAGVGLRDLAALTLVATHDGCSADWLWTRIGLTQSGTVRLIDRLQGLGYLVRARQGRALRLSLTAQGRELLDEWNTTRERLAADALGGLSADQRAQFTELLALALRGTERVRAVADTTCRLCDWQACTACPVDESVGGPR